MTAYRTAPALIPGDADSELRFRSFMETAAANDLARIIAPILAEHLPAAAKRDGLKGTIEVAVGEDYVVTTRVRRMDLVFVKGQIRYENGDYTPFSLLVGVRPTQEGKKR